MLTDLFILGDEPWKLVFYPYFFLIAWNLYKAIKHKNFSNHTRYMSGGGDNDYSPPPAPDPYAMAQAQSQQDRQTARLNALLLNPSIQSPYGNISYDVGQENIGGEIVKRPTQKIELSEAQQRQMDLRNKLSEILGSKGNELASRMPVDPMDVSGFKKRVTDVDFRGVSPVGNIGDFTKERDRIEDAIYQRNLRLLQPEMKRREDELRERLVQTGNPLGTELYRKEMERYDTSRNQALQDLAQRSVLAGGEEQNRLFGIGNILRQQQLEEALRPLQLSEQIRGSQLNEAQRLRNQQINELSALLQGRESIQNPTGAPYQQAAMRSPDISGMMMNNYNNQLNAYNNAYQQEQQNNNSMMSGLFSLGGSILGGPLGGMLGRSMFGGDSGGGLYGRFGRY